MNLVSLLILPAVISLQDNDGAATRSPARLVVLLGAIAVLEAARASVSAADEQTPGVRGSRYEVAGRRDAASPRWRTCSSLVGFGLGLGFCE